MSLCVRILGSFEVLRDDRQLGPGPEAARPRTLLALLAMRANAVVSKDALVEDLWPAPPASARNLVEKYISLWRKALDLDRVQTVGTGYRLRLSREESELDTL